MTWIALSLLLASPGPVSTGAYPKCPVMAPCNPVIHHTQGTRGDLREVQRYRFVGGSADHHRLAVIYGHLGPSSWVPFANLFAFEAGTRTPLFQKTLSGPFGGEGSEEEVTAVENQLIQDSTTELAAAGIEVDDHLPPSIAWCDWQGAIYTDHCDHPVLGLSTASEACPGSWEDPAQLWRICGPADVDGNACVVQTKDPDWDCMPGPVAPIDIYAADGVMWGVVQREVEFATDLLFKTLSTAGR
jgi:hypothetical protein